MATSTSLFDSSVFYRLSNDFTGPNFTLSLGITGLPNTQWPPPAPEISPIGDFSSENWQVFFDDGVYFLRNYDYRKASQLGITDEDRSLPKMLTSSGDLGMQWTIRQWDDDGTWKLSNGLLGSGGLLLGVADAGEFDGSTVLAMNADPNGAHWTFDINVSAGKVDESDLIPFPSGAALASGSTSILSSTPTALTQEITSTALTQGAITTTLTQEPTTTPLVTNTVSGSVNNSSSTSLPTANISHTSGAIASVTVKSLSVAAAAFLVIFLPLI